MHMADALLSPAVGGTMWAATAGTIAYCSKKVREEMDDKNTFDGGAWGIHLCIANDQFQYSCNRFQRTPWRRNDTCNFIGAICSISDHCVGSCCPGSLLCRWRALGIGMQHFQPRVFPGIHRISIYLQKDCRQQRLPRKDNRSGNHLGNNQSSTGSVWRSTGNNNVRYLFSSIFHFFGTHAANPFRHRDC